MNRLPWVLILLAGMVAVHAQQPQRYGFGTAPSIDEIIRWDTDVMPDGRGLPPGSGSVAAGEVLYRDKCQACHGPEGRDGPNAALVGDYDPGINYSRDLRQPRTIGNYWPYATTLYDYIGRAMPYEAPGSLDAAEIYALVAYLLHGNGIIGAGAVMDADTLPAVEMPARHLYYWSAETRP